MKHTFDLFITGVVAIGIVTALSMHASDLASFTSAASTATSGLMSTVEKG